MKPLIDSEEVWKPIPSYEGLYEVSDRGNVRSLHVEPRLLKQGCGIYKIVSLWKEGRGRTFSVHSLVARVFLGEPSPGMQVNHLDEDKYNNHSSNLVWATPSDNTKHSSHKMRGELQGGSKLKEEDVREIRRRLSEGCSQSKLAKEYGIHKSSIYAIAARKNWEWLT